MVPEPRRRRFRTVRVRVTALATLAVAVVLVVASALLVVRQRSGLVEQLDDSLVAEADRLASADDGGAPASVEDRVVVVVDGRGTVVATSGDGADVIGPQVQLSGGDDDGRDVSIDGEAYRVVSSSNDDPGGVVLVGAPLDDVDESVAELTTSLAWIVPLATLALAIVVWVVVGLTLRPVERIRVEVATIGLADLDRRVPEPSGDDEIVRLAVTMNEMLARLEAAARRQQRFVADASHELRTPLTRMRTELEVDERHPEQADVGATRRSVLEEIGALQRLIDDLLVLARIDAGALADRSTPVDLDDLVLDEVRAAAGSRIIIDEGGVSAAQVAGDREELRRVVRNLLDNARRHARSTVTVELVETEGRATLAVSDDGPGIPTDRRADIFERFSRLDEARTGGAGRAGLGLAIVHDIVTRHGGTVTVDDAPGGARFVVALPVCPSGSAQTGRS